MSALTAHQTDLTSSALVEGRKRSIDCSMAKRGQFGTYESRVCSTIGVGRIRIEQITKSWIGKWNFRHCKDKSNAWISCQLKETKLGQRKMKRKGKKTNKKEKQNLQNYQRGRFKILSHNLPIGNLDRSSNIPVIHSTNRSEPLFKHNDSNTRSQTDEQKERFVHVLIR